MNLKRILEPQGLNWWTIVSGMGMNFLLMVFLSLGLVTFTVEETMTKETSPMIFVTIMSLGSFLIPLLTAYVCGRLSGERYMAYAMYPLAGFMILAVPGVVMTGLSGLLVIGFGVLGAFNGANLAARRAMRRRHTMDEQD